MATKIAPFVNEATFYTKSSVSDSVDLIRTKICTMNTFGEQLPVKNRLE